MEKFSKTLHGYNPVEVNRFLDNIISKVEKMVAELKDKDSKIIELSKLELENQALKEKINQYERTESAVNKAIVMAERTSEQIKVSARNDADAMIEDAKNKANRIINEALLKAEKAEQEANMLRRNINIFKRRVKDIISAQMDVVDEMDDIDL